MERDEDVTLNRNADARGKMPKKARRIRAPDGI